MSLAHHEQLQATLKDVEDEQAFDEALCRREEHPSLSANQSESRLAVTYWSGVDLQRSKLYVRFHNHTRTALRVQSTLLPTICSPQTQGNPRNREASRVRVGNYRIIDRSDFDILLFLRFVLDRNRRIHGRRN